MRKIEVIRKGSVQSAALRRIDSVAKGMVSGFNVFAWLKNNPSVEAAIEAAQTEVEVIRLVRPYLEPHLNDLASGVNRARERKKIVRELRKHAKAEGLTLFGYVRAARRRECSLTRAIACQVIYDMKLKSGPKG